MKAVYQLNKYNKAWPNTNVAKTPSLFTVEFQELLEIFWERYRFNSREFFTFICIHTLRLQTRAFYTKQDFSRALSFPHHTLCSEHEHSFVNERTSISKAVLEIEANAVIYLHTCIHTCILGRTYFVKRSIHLIEEQLIPGYFLDDFPCSVFLKDRGARTIPNHRFT